MYPLADGKALCELLTEEEERIERMLYNRPSEQAAQERLATDLARARLRRNALLNEIAERG